MTITLPSSVNMKMRFPEFADVEDTTIEFAIEEASGGVDDSWLDRDKTLAVMYLAAHYLMVSIQRSESATGQSIRSETIGRMSITYDSAGAVNADAGDLGSTQYGTRYLDMLRGNKPPIMVI
jgi:hypothetical protein